MLLLSRLATLCLILPFATAAQNAAPTIQPIPWPAPAGSTQLWNGHDITGWTIFLKGGIPAPDGYWTAADGVLHFVGKPSGYLRTEKDYSNYHLHVEWRWGGTPKAGTNNSGIFVFQHPPDVVWPYSVQVQVKEGSCGDLISQGGLLFPAPDTNPTIKKLAPPSEKTVGDWNSHDIYCRGASIEVYVNGVRQNFVDKLPADSGEIALQVEGYPIEFRTIWIEPL
jgi:hypothetical protein